MADFVAWRFLIFVAIFGMLVYLQFYLAHREWRKLKGEQASDIDVNYVRTEDYFAQSFRMKAQDWLKLPSSVDDQGATVIVKGNERIRLLENLGIAADGSCRDIVITEHDFSCGPRSTMTREIWARGNAVVGSESRLQALAADGAVDLGENVTIARWLDSNGPLTIGAGCRVGARITSRARILLGTGAEIRSAFAPEIGSAGWDGKVTHGDPAQFTLLDLDLSQDSADVGRQMAAAGLSQDRLLQLGPDTWIYRGDLAPSVAIRLKTNLVVKGDCFLPAACVLEADLRADGSLFLGPSCVSHGNLIADGDIFLGRSCQFSGLVHAGKSALFSQWTRGFNPQATVAVYADENMSLETDVAVGGKIAAGGRVEVVDSTGAFEWKARRGIGEKDLRVLAKGQGS